MKYLIISLALLTVLLAASPILGQTQVVNLDRAGWPQCYFNEVAGLVSNNFDIYLVNQNGNGCSYFPSCAWVVEGKESGSEVTIEVEGDLANWDYTIIHRGDINSEVDTIGIVFTPAEGPGPIYDGFDGVAVRLGITPRWPTEILESISIRAISTIEADGYSWQWVGADGCSDIVPEFDVENQTVALDVNASFYNVAVPDCCFPEFEPPTPDTIYGAYCDTLSAVFRAFFWEDLMWRYEITGPGTINSRTGVWTWDGATQEDIGVPIELWVHAEQWGCQATSHKATIIVTDKQPLGFTSGCNKTVFVKGPETRYPFTATADCPANPLEFFVVDDTGFDGECFFEGNELVIQPTPEMIGELDVVVGVTDGVDTQTCIVNLLTGPYPCCGLYTGGYSGNADCDPDGHVNLSDITRMIDHVYISYEPLCCPENGNTDGDDEWEITLSDITRLIDHVYISHVATAPCR